MSRIGKNPVIIPSGVEASLAGDILTVKGSLGTLTHQIHPLIAVEIKDGKIILTPKDMTKQARSLWGTTRSILNNHVKGVSEGFVVRLEVHGVGYRATVQGQKLVMQLGYSHDIEFPIPEGISMTVDKNPVAINVKGFDKQQVGQVAAKIREYRKPEPYKGKGIRRSDEYVLRKEGKKK